MPISQPRTVFVLGIGKNMLECLLDLFPPDLFFRVLQVTRCNQQGGTFVQGVANVTAHEMVHGLTDNQIGEGSVGLMGPGDPNFGPIPSMTLDEIMNFQDANCQYQQGDFGSNQGPIDQGPPDSVPA